MTPETDAATEPPTRWLDPYATRSIPAAKTAAEPATEPATEPAKKGPPLNGLLEAVESLREIDPKHPLLPENQPPTKP